VAFAADNQAKAAAHAKRVIAALRLSSSPR
jgi:hypothetical protein